MSQPELGSQIPFFLESFLSKPATALPKGAQWVLAFEGVFQPDNKTGNLDYTEVIPVPAIQIGLRYEPKQWDVTRAIETTLAKDYQQTKGCMFVQAVQIPSEGNQVNPEGLQQSGYIRTVTGNGRDAFQNVNISFLETNVSFVDNVIRPWVVATAHLGMIARSGAENYRCNFSVYKLGVSAPNIPPHVLIKYTFYGACPISVTGEEYTYTQTTSPINREATFTYHYYTIDSAAGNTSITENNSRTPLPLSTRSRQNNLVL